MPGILIGPPTRAPYWFSLVWFFGSPPVLFTVSFAQLLVLSDGCRKYSYALPLNRFVPERVVKLIVTAPLPPMLAPATAVVTVTASTASCRGYTEAKKPSPVLLKLSWLLTPSSVMLIIDCGRPLIVESRFTPGVFTPGRNVTAFSALRDVVGMRFS